ncbi:hypothetical protein EDC01DRAFT_663363 [Geopyxis carbonaria]|nr:hypothetical protein EDC01DRAFT_663363 [Geopyxis carbonaria]
MLVAKAQALGVEIVLASSVCAIDFDPRRPRVTFTNGKSLTADLVLAADGLKSTSRSLLLGRADPPHLTGDLAYRITIPAAQMRADPLLRPLTETPEINIWLGPDAHAVCYLLKGGELYNIVACCPDTLPADTAIAAATAEEALSVFAGWDERLTRLVALGDGFSKWRLQNSRGMKSWRHECGRFALLGDACHATLPYLASGAAMAIEDGAVLGELLARVKSAEELPEVLRVYEDMRKPRTERVVTGSTAQREVFHMHDGAEQTERDRVLREDAQEKVKGVFPNRWRDAEFQSWLWGYDVEVEVEKAWSAAFGAKAGDAEKGADIAAEEAKADSGVDV